MSTPPPILVLLDLSALMGRRTREWQEYSRIGNCYVPEVIYQEIESLADCAPEPEVETVAREFMRFFPNSGWQITNAHAAHSLITPPGGASLSKQARMVVTVAQCAYGFAQENSDNLVIFVSNTQAILQRIPSLGVSNVCGLTRAAFLQWVRTGEQPPAVTEQLQIFSIAQASSRNSQVTPVRETPTPPPATIAPEMIRLKSSVLLTPSDSWSRSTGTRSTGTGLSARIISTVVTFVMVSILGLVAWRFLQPASFNQFWQQMGFPNSQGQ